ncbi:MFS transporter [Streptomyces sp. NPDC004721]
MSKMPSRLRTSKMAVPTERGRARRAVVASMLSTAIEWYDYYLYGLVSGLVFASTFFPEASGATGTMQAFGIYGVGFVARPVGAALFGHFGDRVGRKNALVWSTLCMGVPTVAVAFVPGYDVIGLGGALILTVLRLVQGIGLGGQWAGAVLVSMESGRRERRGLLASWAQVGSPLGLILANLVLVVTIALTSTESFQAWAWRVPFLLSGVLLGITFYIRMRVEETPEFSGYKTARKNRSNPVAMVLRHHWRKVLLAALVRTSEMAPFYIFTAFVVTYCKNVLHTGDSFALSAVLIASFVSLGTIPLFGFVSDRIGRKRTYILGAGLTAVWGLFYFPLLDTAVPALIVLSVVVSLITHDIQYGPQAAFIAESFPTDVRYSGTALGSQLASIISGGPAPIIATALVANFGSASVGWYLVACAVIGGAAAAGLRAAKDPSPTSPPTTAPTGSRAKPSTLG